MLKLEELSAVVFFARAERLYVLILFVVGAADNYERMRITANTVQSFKVAKIFKENTDKINSVTFSQSGEFLISSSDDDSIVIYDCVQGNPKRTLNSKKYGVDLIQLTHNNDTVSFAMRRRLCSVFALYAVFSGEKMAGKRRRWRRKMELRGKGQDGGEKDKMADIGRANDRKAIT